MHSFYWMPLIIMFACNIWLIMSNGNRIIIANDNKIRTYAKYRSNQSDIEHHEYGRVGNQFFI